MQRFRLCAQHSPVLSCRPGMCFLFGKYWPLAGAMHYSPVNAGGDPEVIVCRLSVFPFASTLSPISNHLDCMLVMDGIWTYAHGLVPGAVRPCFDSSKGCISQHCFCMAVTFVFLMKRVVPHRPVRAHSFWNCPGFFPSSFAQRRLCLPLPPCLLHHIFHFVARSHHPPLPFKLLPHT